MPKCRFCGKQLKKESAYLVKRGKSNVYYCSFEHSISKKPRDIMYEKLEDLFGRKVLNTVLYKEFDLIGKVHTYEKCISYIDDNYDGLKKIMSKSFVSEFAEIKYLAAVFKNSLSDYVEPQKTKNVFLKNGSAQEFMNEPLDENKNKKVKAVQGLDDLLGVLMDD